MASRTIVELIDDLDNKPIKQGEGETINFGLENVQYTIDLSKANAEKFRKALNPYIAAARTVGGKRDGRRKGPARGSSREYTPKAVRAWAEAKGIPLPARGRIPGDVVAQWQAARD